MRMIHTKKVKVREAQGDFIITPIREENVDCPLLGCPLLGCPLLGCPLLGMFSDGKISVEKFMAQKQAKGT